MKTLSNKEWLPFIVAIVTLLLLVLIETTPLVGGVTWYFPVSWGATKEILIDPIYILLLPWKGWVFLLPLVVSLYLEAGYKKITILLFFVGFSVGVLEAYLRFVVVDVNKLFTGIVTYIFIFTLILLITYFIKFMFEIVVKKRS